MFIAPIYWCYLCWQHQYQPIQLCLPRGKVYSFWRIFSQCFLRGDWYGSTPTPSPVSKGRDQWELRGGTLNNKINKIKICLFQQISTRSGKLRRKSSETIVTISTMQQDYLMGEERSIIWLKYRDLWRATRLEAEASVFSLGPKIPVQALAHDFWWFVF